MLSHAESSLHPFGADMAGGFERRASGRSAELGTEGGVPDWSVLGRRFQPLGVSESGGYARLVHFHR